MLVPEPFEDSHLISMAQGACGQRDQLNYSVVILRLGACVSTSLPLTGNSIHF